MSNLQCVLLDLYVSSATIPTTTATSAAATTTTITAPAGRSAHLIAAILCACQRSFAVRPEVARLVCLAQSSVVQGASLGEIAQEAIGRSALCDLDIAQLVQIEEEARSGIDLAHGMDGVADAAVRWLREKATLQ